MLTKQKRSSSTVVYPNSWFLQEITTCIDFPSASVCSWWTMLVIFHPLDSGSSCPVLCLQFYVALVFSLFTVPANAYPPSPLHSKFNLTGTLQLKDGAPYNRWQAVWSLPLHVVRVELSGSRARANMAKARQVDVISSRHCPELCGTVRLQTVPLTFPFLH